MIDHDVDNDIKPAQGSVLSFNRSITLAIAIATVSILLAAIFLSYSSHSKDS